MKEDFCNSSWKFCNNGYRIGRIAKCICRIRELLIPFHPLWTKSSMVFEDQLQGQGVERLTITVQFCQNDLISTLHVPHYRSVNLDTKFYNFHLNQKTERYFFSISALNTFVSSSSTQGILYFFSSISSFKMPDDTFNSNR